MKVIVIKDYLKFSNRDYKALSPEHIVHAHRHGYWNVFIYNAELEKFLIDTEIEHIVREEFPF